MGYTQSTEFERKEDTSGQRWYRARKDEEDEWSDWYPSVTTVPKVILDSGLQWWLENNTPAEIHEKQQQGIRVGNIVHDGIEDLIEGETVDISDVADDTIRKHASQCLEGFVNFYNDHNLEPKAWELTVLNSKYGMAGQFDYWGKVDGEWWLLDYKTSSQKDDFKWPLQLTGYATSDPFREADHRPNLGIVHLRKGRYNNKKGYIFRPNKKDGGYEYKENLLESVVDIWKDMNNTTPKFPEEVPTEFDLS